MECALLFIYPNCMHLEHICPNEADVVRIRRTDVVKASIQWINERSRACFMAAALFRLGCDLLHNRLNILNHKSLFFYRFLQLRIVHAILIEHAGNASVYVRICTDDAVLGGQGFFNGFLAVCTVHTLDPHDLGRGTRCNRFLGKIFAARTSIPIAAAGTAASTGASAASAAFSRVMTDRRT